jgi:hypothetical protein
MRRAAFDSVNKQEADEKNRTTAITKDHDTQASAAAAAKGDSHGLLEWRRRNGAARARDSLRFVDTENEDNTGKKYGGRALAQLISNLGMRQSPAEEAKEKRDSPEAKPEEEKKKE